MVLYIIFSNSIARHQKRISTTPAETKAANIAMTISDKDIVARRSGCFADSRTFAYVGRLVAF